MKKILLLIASAFVLLTSCKLDLKIYLDNIALATSAKSIVVGESLTLEVIFSPTDATDQSLRWSSSDDSIVTVSKSGEIKGIAPGQATITVVANDGGFKDNCTVTVKDREVHVTGLVWAHTSSTTDAVTISKSDHVTLEVSVLPSDATNKKVSWTSSNEKVIIVDSTGKLTPVADGQASVVVTTEEGGFTAVCEVTVSENASGISLSETALTLKEYEQKVLVATVTPADATDKTVIWSSSDPTVAVVAYGNVTALKAGTCEITATHGAYSAKCVVTVTCPVHGVDLNEHSATLKADGSFQLVASVHPDRASDKTLEWSSANPAVASVSADGLVTGIGLGETEITVTSVDNPSAVAQCKVKVIATEISVSPETLDIYENGEPVQLTVTGADPKDITWTSRDKAIATVDANGKVSGLKAGTTEIYAVCKDGGSMAFCRVNVHTHVQSIDVYHDGKLVEDDEIVNVFIHENVEFEAVLQPKETILDKKVTWKSSDNKILLWLDDEQRFLARSTGDATVTVTAADGGITASVKVHVGEHVSSVSIEPESILEGFYVDEHVVIKAVVQPADAINKKVVWSSEDNSIVSVRDNGDGSARLSALKHGSVYITAKSVDGGKEGKCKVVVTSKVDGVEIFEGDVRVTSTSKTVPVGASCTLRAVVRPDTVTDKSVIWESSDPKVATVTKDGVVSILSDGNAVITATSVLGGASAGVTFIACPVISDIKLSKSEVSLSKDSRVKLDATAVPDNAYDKGMIWSSSDDSVATVDQEGNVYAVGSGKANIIVKSTAVTAVQTLCKVTVNTPVKSVDISSDVASIAVGENMTLTATVLPEDADNPNVKWVSSDDSIVTVSNQGQIRGIAPGNAVVTVYSEENHDIRSECAVNVIKEKKPVTSITFNVKSQQMNVNSTCQIVATVLPDDATFKTLTWTSSDESVATVDDNGLVSAKAEGSTIIVARANDGSGKSASCSITVVDPSNIKITSLTFSPVESQYLELGHTLTIIPVIVPENATNKTLTWNSSDEKIATVDNQGVVTPVAKGNVTISARTTDRSDKSASLTITVVDQYVPVNGVSIYYNGKECYKTTMGESETRQFDAVLNPSDATNQNVVWSKNGGAWGTIAPEGKACKVTAGVVPEGSEYKLIVLTVTSEEGEKAFNCEIRVERIQLESISFAKSDVSVQKGKKIQLEVNYLPANASPSYKELYWSYGEGADKSVATVDTKGLVTGLKAGTCTFVATSKKDPEISAQCTVTVVNGSDSEHLGFEDWN